MHRFQIISNEIILDEETNLQWAMNYVEKKTWDQAHEYCDELNAQKYGGFDDWRLPTIEELRMLVDYSRFDPASLFPDMPPKTFWSSSSFAYNTANAWLVLFDYGNVYYDYKTNVGAARCARSGPLTLNSSKKKSKKKKEVPLPFFQLPLRRF